MKSLSNSTAQTWIDGCAQWLYDEVRLGSEPVYLNFMFQPLQGSPAAVQQQMQEAIYNDFYSPLCSWFTHHPRAAAEWRRLPKAMLFPDLPVIKSNKSAFRHDGSINYGLHYNGPLIVPREARLRQSFDDFVLHEMNAFAGPRIMRIDVRPITKTYDKLADYALKTIKWNRASVDDIVILPRVVSELPTKRPAVLPADRVLKDLMTATNLSEEMARHLLLSVSRGVSP